MPSILLINRVYPPDDGATGRVMEHVAEGFAHAGWEVSVLTTACPGASAGVTFRHGVKIIRAGTIFSKRNLFFRALGYALMIPSLGIKALLLPRADVVVTKTDPPMLLVLGPVLRVLKGSRLIHWAQDLYPEVAEEVGVFRAGGMIAGVLRGISTLSLRSHDRIVVVGRCMAERVAARGISADRIRMIPNTGIEQKIHPIDHSANLFRKRHGLEGFFVVEYSGNMGRSHEFSTVLAAAQKLQERGENSILFLLIGAGPGELSLRKEVEQKRLNNVRFLPSQPLNELSESLGAGDLHLVTMRKEMSGLVVPSKFYGILAAERPVLFIGPEESEVARVIREQGVGAVIEPGESDGLISAILAYRDVPERREREGIRGRAVVSEADSLKAWVNVAKELV